MTINLRTGAGAEDCLAGNQSINMRVEAINKAQQGQVIAETNHCITRAAEHFERTFSELPIYFDLRGKAAGMYRLKNGERHIRYNPYILGRYFEDSLAQTVPHEVAHYVADMLHGFQNIRPHGPEWKEIILFFGASTRATCHYNLDGLPARKQQLFSYSCECTAHQLSSRRHYKVLRKQMQYICRKCGSTLTKLPQEA